MYLFVHERIRAVYFWLYKYKLTGVKNRTFVFHQNLLTKNRQITEAYGVRPVYVYNILCTYRK